MNEKEKDLKQEHLDRLCAQLSEHFDCVQIVASSLKPDGETELWYKGSGNYYARTGMCREWLDRNDASNIGWYVARSIKDSDE